MMDVQLLLEIMNTLGDGYTDTLLLIVLVILDTTLAITWRLKEKRGLTSASLLSGLLRNTLMAFVPSLVSMTTLIHPPASDNVTFMYTVVTFILTVFVFLGLLQSLLAWSNIWGMTLPKAVSEFVLDEVRKKVIKHDNTDRKG